MGINNRAFSLVEMMVVAAIMGFVMVGFSSLFIQMTKNMKKLEIKQDIGTLTTEVQSTIGSGNTCKNAVADGLGGLQTFSAAHAQQPALVGGNFNPDGNAGLEINFALVNGNVLGAPASGGAINDIPGYSFGVASLKLYDATQIGTTGGNAIYKASLYGTFVSNALGYDTQFGPKQIGSLNIVVNGTNQIVGCFGVGADEAGIQEICQSFGGTYDAANNSCQIPTASVASLCPGFGGTYDASTNTCAITGAGGGSLTTCGGYPSPGPGSVQTGGSHQEMDGCGGWYVYTCIGGTWVQTGDYHGTCSN